MVTESVRDLALRRVALVFHRPQHGVRLTDRFDIELKAGPPSDFQPNEFDQLLEDVQQMQSRGLRLDRTIYTVDDFCAFVERFALDCPAGWALLRRQWNKEESMVNAPAWRKAVWRWMGL